MLPQAGIMNGLFTIKLRLPEPGSSATEFFFFQNERIPEKASSQAPFDKFQSEIRKKDYFCNA
jgi:hypothetical protein